MNKGIEILLSRMDSHPEEFELQWDGGPYAVEGNRWQSIFYQIRQQINHLSAVNADTSTALTPLPFLPEEEVRAIYDKWLSLQGPAFERYIMRELLEGEKKTDTLVSTQGTMAVNQWPHPGNTIGVAQCNTSTSLKLSAATVQKWRQAGLLTDTEEEPDG